MMEVFRFFKELLIVVDYSSEIGIWDRRFCVEFWVNLSTSSGNQYF